jgi:hypothetical protein
MFIFSKARFEKGKTSKLPFIIHIPSSQKNFIGQQCFFFINKTKLMANSKNKNDL